MLNVEFSNRRRTMTGEHRDTAELDAARARLMRLAIALEQRFGAETAADIFTTTAATLVMAQLGRVGAAERLRLIAMAIERGDSIGPTWGSA
jgi:hypothetical protein